MSRRWLPPVLWAAFILMLTSIPGSIVAELGEVPAGTDKVVHATMYGVLGWLSARAAWHPDRPWTVYVLMILAIAVLAALDEWHQTFIPGREPNVWDWVADMAGVMLGVGAYVLLRRRERPT